MKNAATLALVMARIDMDKPLLEGEKRQLRDALESLAELTDMVNDQCDCGGTGAVPLVCVGSCPACGRHATNIRATTPQCPYTFAHTKKWCGYDGCREA